MRVRLNRPTLLGLLDEDLSIVQLTNAKDIADKTGDETKLDEIETQLDKTTEEDEDPPEDTPTDGEEVTPPSDSEDTPTEDTGDGPTEADADHSDIVEPEDTPVDEKTISTESIRNDIVRRTSLEGITYEDVKDVAIRGSLGFYAAAVYSASLVADLVKYLAPIGAKYSMILAKKLSAASAHAFVLSLKTFYKLLISTSNFIKRIRNEFGGYKKDIADLRKKIADLKEKQADPENKDEPKTLDGKFYDKESGISFLSYNGKPNIAETLKITDRLMNETVRMIDEQIMSQITDLQKLIDAIGRGTREGISEHMDTSTFAGKLIAKSIPSNDTGNDLVESFVYPVVLPGNYILAARLPKKGLKEIEDLSKAYNGSALYMTSAGHAPSLPESLDYMEADDLLKLLDAAEKICDGVLKHEALYRRIDKEAAKLKFGYRAAYQRLIASEEKKNLHDSLVEYVHLKQSFISRVYIAASFDVDDYFGKYLKHLLDYAKQNIKALS